jgi:hypothetical protein
MEPSRLMTVALVSRTSRQKFDAEKRRDMQTLAPVTSTP